MIAQSYVLPTFSDDDSCSSDRLFASSLHFLMGGHNTSKFKLQLPLFLKTLCLTHSRFRLAIRHDSNFKLHISLLLIRSDDPERQIAFFFCSPSDSELSYEHWKSTRQVACTILNILILGHKSENEERMSRSFPNTAHLSNIWRLISLTDRLMSRTNKRKH